jgi:S-adenosylmethionine:tRNA ribosyltransferase-isomerase
MVVLYRSGRVIHSVFSKIDSFLSPDYLTVINNTMVFPARLFGKKTSGGKVEFLLVRAVDNHRWESLVKPYARIKEGSEISIDGWDQCVVIKKKLPDGRCIVDFGNRSDPIEVARRFGKMPLPPYIKRDKKDNQLDQIDQSRYQTIFARHVGSVAAPTASLHFSPEIIERFKSRRMEFADLTLHVGPGTFRPVKTERVADHVMDYEYFSLSAESADKINAYTESNKHILPVGTTVVRSLESVADANGRVAQYHGKTNLFIYPGYTFKLVKNMLTNFHLPKSTLLMLICALAGKDLIMRAYHEAIARKYRFYSYGDAMVIT